MRYPFAACLVLTGCAITVPPGTGTHFTIEHGTAIFSEAMRAAQVHCAKMGMHARHLGTDRAYLMLSRFECIGR